MPVSVLSRVGLMRAEFFIDYIDIDFCLRLQRAGLTMVAVGDACLQHRFGVPAEGDGRRWRRAHSSARLRTIFQNRLQVWRDYGGLWPGYVLFDGFAVIRDLLRIIVSDPERSEKLRAIWDGIRAAIRRP
jgi:rhamnosyltransferase